MPTAEAMMTTQTPLGKGEFARLALLAGGTAAVLAGLGWLPTLKVGGSGAWVEMLSGIGVSLAASLVAAILLAGLSNSAPRDRQSVTLLAMAIRMAVTLALLLTLVLEPTWLENPWSCGPESVIWCFSVWKRPPWFDCCVRIHDGMKCP